MCEIILKLKYLGSGQFIYMYEVKNGISETYWIMGVKSVCFVSNINNYIHSYIVSMGFLG